MSLSLANVAANRAGSKFMDGKIKVAIIGSGNIGTDLMIKILRLSKTLEVTALAGIDPQSEGLRLAKRLGVATTSGGISEAPRVVTVPVALMTCLRPSAS